MDHSFTVLRKLFIAMVCLFWASGIAFAQNVEFSQFHYTPLTINPAFVAADNDATVIVNHRNQQISNELQLSTTMVTMMMPMVDLKKGKHFGGFGLNAFSDRTGANQAFFHQGLTATFGLKLDVSQRSSMSFGMNAGYQQKGISTAGFTTGSQWEANRGFNANAPIGEQFENERTGYVTAGAGLLWVVRDAETGIKNSFFGFSGQHINRPNETFGGANAIVPIKYTAFAGKVVYSKNKFDVRPEVLYTRQGNVNFTNVGTVYSYYFDNNNPEFPIKNGSIDFSTRYIVGNALILALQFNQPNFTMGFSYDIGAGKASAINASRGATEFAIALRKTIIYKKPKKVIKKVVDNYSIGQVREFYTPKDKEDPKEENPEATQAPKQKEKIEYTDNEFFSFQLKKDFKFGFNEASLNEEAKEYLEEMIKLLDENPRLKLKVIGHTDNVGTDAANQKVSLQRAKLVVDYLIEQGVDKRRLTAIGKADKEPLYPNANNEGRAKNRRVEFIISYE
jgi:type IX secretion system PorP/SprF family membrane protein